MNTLDIIKYISFRPKHSKVLSVIALPVAYITHIEYKTYGYNIKNEKHILFFISIFGGKFIFDRQNPMGAIDCDINTVFGDKYKGYFHRIIYTTQKMTIQIVSNKKMRYENNCLRSINHNKRFELMELKE